MGARSLCHIISISKIMKNLIKDLDLSPRIKIRIINGSKKFKLLDDLLLISPQDLKNITKLSEDDILKILKALSDKFYKNDFSNYFSFNTVYTNPQCISTGLENFDQILKGGILCQGITEISGCSGVGKTQFCLHLCSRLAKSIYNNQNYKNDCNLYVNIYFTLNLLGIIYVNTENAFPVKRLEQIMLNYLENYYDNKNLQQLTQNIMSSIYLDHIGDLVI
ncbi:DNA repair protein RAD51 homolog 2-like [Gordionus sp. m RMFG-2023]|uniref:DNA repair protein RAD51 homolog 2-like n=1 Tax=Gordionus sp. m RMFG-2023 TaxID=3053472 RepID=UPI0031FBCF76